MLFFQSSCVCLLNQGFVSVLGCVYHVVWNHRFSKVLSSLLVVFQCCCGAQFKHGFVLEFGSFPMLFGIAV